MTQAVADVIEDRRVSLPGEPPERTPQLLEVHGQRVGRPQQDPGVDGREIEALGDEFAGGQDHDLARSKIGHALLSNLGIQRPVDASSRNTSCAKLIGDVLGVSHGDTEGDSPLIGAELSVVRHRVTGDARGVDDLLGLAAVEVAGDLGYAGQVWSVLGRVVDRLGEKSVVDEPLDGRTHDHAVEHGS